MKKLIPLFLMLLGTAAFSQQDSPFGKVDTVTFGECDDSNPVLLRGMAGWYSDEYSSMMLFIRNEDSTSSILSKRYNVGDDGWDSSAEVIYQSPIKNSIQHLDFSAAHYYGNSSYHSFALAVWENNQDGVSSIVYSFKKESDSVWSDPYAVTNDSVNNTDPRVSIASDSMMIILWKQGNSLLYSLVNPSGRTDPDTVGFAASDLFEYDISSRFGDGVIVWTNADTLFNNIIHLRSITNYPEFSFTDEETIPFDSAVYRPRIVQGMYGPRTFLYETSIAGKHEIMFYPGYYWGTYPSENVSQDTLADDRNPDSFVSPVVTTNDLGTSQMAFPYYNGLLVYEKYSGQDSMLIFNRWDHIDSVKSSGYNRNACIGGDMYYSGGRLNVLTVWESNRTGRPHIYSRVSQILIDNVTDEPNEPGSFSLEQNYPNPFNPSTTIQFTLPKSVFVSLRIYDRLGRTISTLVNENMTPGRHSKTWNAQSISSGVYFYVLKAGTFQQVKKLILLK
ncbi:MAG: T9SS type A sorting domain-containing protein [Bacteroidota bacterium]